MSQDTARARVAQRMRLIEHQRGEVERLRQNTIACGTFDAKQAAEAGLNVKPISSSTSQAERDDILIDRFNAAQWGHPLEVVKNCIHILRNAVELMTAEAALQQKRGDLMPTFRKSFEKDHEYYHAVRKTVGDLELRNRNGRLPRDYEIDQHRLYKALADLMLDVKNAKSGKLKPEVTQSSEQELLQKIYDCRILAVDLALDATELEIKRGVDILSKNVQWVIARDLGVAKFNKAQELEMGAGALHAMNVIPRAHRKLGLIEIFLIDTFAGSGNAMSYKDPYAVSSFAPVTLNSLPKITP